MSKLSILIAIALVILFPLNSFAWGPGVHIGVSLSVIDQLPDYLKILIMSNINEYLYGSLAPDFIVGKTLSEFSGHSHNWDVGFKILEMADNDRKEAFAYGYLSHLSQDAVAHGILANGMNGKLKNTKHMILELVADNMCSSTFKYLAVQTLKKYNKELDNDYKKLVESVLFSFGVSKLIFKGMVRVSLGRKIIKKAIYNERFFEFIHLNFKEIESYIKLSKQFSLDVLVKGMESPVVKISAISR